MELTDSVMCDLHLDIHMGLNDSFSFSPRAMGSLSSNSVSSSCTSPDYGPFTPTSGRSTSPRSNSMDFGASFDSYNSLSFDLTPPSSAISTSFSMGSSFTSDGSDMLLSDLPVTPTRSRVNTGYSNLTLGSCGSQTQVTPSSAIPMYSFADNTLGSTFTSTPGYGNNWDASSMWPETGSPVNFELFTVPPRGPDRSLDGVKKASAALQREQQKKTGRKRPRGPSKRGPVVQDIGFDSMGGVFTTVPKFRHHCDVLGCTKSYLRKEHLSRHKESHTGKQIHCAWCKHIANRADNFSQHLKKHLKADSRSPRVKLVTDPLERVKIFKMLEMMKVRRKATQPETESKVESDCKTKLDLYKSESKFKDEAE